MSEPFAEQSVLAFVDILGFKEMVRHIPEGNSEILQNLVSALRQTMEISLNEDIILSTLPPVKVTSFSDCVVISTPLARGAEWRIIEKAGKLSLSLLRNGIVCRGGITHGIVFHNGWTVVGPALVDAYDLESRCANYPRIIVADSVAEAINLPLYVQMRPPVRVAKDLDGLFYVDLVGRLKDDKDCGDLLVELRRVVGDRVAIELGKAKLSNQYDRIAKWRWLEAKFAQD